MSIDGFIASQTAQLQTLRERHQFVMNKNQGSSSPEARKLKKQIEAIELAIYKAARKGVLE